MPHQLIPGILITSENTGKRHNIPTKRLLSAVLKVKFDLINDGTRPI